MREISVLGAYILLLILIAILAPSFFTAANVRDVMLSNVPVLVTAIGMTMVILIGEIDISVAAQFAIYTVLAGLSAKAGVPVPLVALIVPVAGMIIGAANGVLIAGLGLPSIVVTLASMVILRDCLRWTTGGAWVQDLPPALHDRKRATWCFSITTPFPNRAGLRRSSTRSRKLPTT